MFIVLIKCTIWVAAVRASSKKLELNTSAGMWITEEAWEGGYSRPHGLRVSLLGLICKEEWYHETLQLRHCGVAALEGGEGKGVTEQGLGR